MSKMINSRVMTYKFVLMVGIPCLMPGLLFFTIYEGNYVKAAIFLITAIYPCYLFYTNLSTIKSVEGYLQKLYLGCLITLACFILIAISPEKNNARAGAVLLVFLPCVIIVSHLISGSSPAKKLRMILENS